MLQLDCLIYTILTVFIPLRLTYKTFKQEKIDSNPSLWSHYWAFFMIVKLLQCFLPVFSYQPFKLGLLLFHLWLYSSDYQGALLLSALAKKKISALGFQNYIQIVAQNLKILKVFDLDENSSKKQPVPQQTKKQQ